MIYFRRSLYALAAFLFCFFSVISEAEESFQEPITEADFYEFPFVLSATRLEQPINESPAAVTIISRDMINASGAHSIADIFRLAPGMVVGFDSGYSPVVAYHGLSSSYSRRMQVLVDGRSVYEPSFGGVDWASLPLSIDDIDRIEIVRGSNAATFGANAFLGIINIITRDAILDDGISINTLTGSRGTTINSFRYGGELWERTDFRFTVETQDGDGLKDLNDDYQINTVKLRMDSNLSQHDFFSLQLGVANSDVEHAAGFLSPKTIQDSSTDFIQASFSHDLGGGDEFSIQVFRNSDREKENWQSGEVFYDRDALKLRKEIEAQHIAAVSPDSRLVWGVGVRQDEMVDEPTFNTGERLKISMRRLFWHVESHLSKRLLLNAGLMYEDHSWVEAKASPRLAFNYMLDEGHGVRFSISRAYRNPTMFEERVDMRFKTVSGVELFQLFDADGNIEPEVIDAYELGYFIGVPEIRGNFDIKLFQDEIDKLIRPYFDMTNSVLSFRNRDSAKIRGLELQLDSQPYKRTSIFASYSFTEIDSDDLDGNYSQSAPKHKVSFLGSYKFDNGLQTGLVYHYVDEMEWLGTNDPLDAYDKLDLNFSRQYKLDEFEAEWQIAFQGLSGRYADFDNNVVFDRGLYVSINLRH